MQKYYTNTMERHSQSVTEYYVICTLCIIRNPTGYGPLEMRNYCEGDNRLGEKAKDKMQKAMKKTLCCYSSVSPYQHNPAQLHVKKSNNRLTKLTIPSRTRSQDHIHYMSYFSEQLFSEESVRCICMSKFHSVNFSSPQLPSSFWRPVMPMM